MSYVDQRQGIDSFERQQPTFVVRQMKLGVVTVRDLIEHLLELTPVLKQFGIWLVSVFKIRQATDTLFAMLANRALRQYCASTLGFLGPESKIIPGFLKIGRCQLSAERTDPSWLSAVVYGLNTPANPQAVEMLVTIFERQGWETKSVDRATLAESTG